MSLPSFRRVLVMGATQTGKTTLLSKGICGEFDEYYTPTHQAQTFYDCKRRLEFVDTPGISDDVLTYDYPGKFRKDVLVTRLIASNEFTQSNVADNVETEEEKKVMNLNPKVPDFSKQEERNKSNPLIGSDGKEIDTRLVDMYVIVYTNCVRSKYIARSLKRAIRENETSDLKQCPIFLVKNECSIPRPEHPLGNELKKWEDAAALAAKTEKLAKEEEERLNNFKAVLEADNVEIMKRLFANDDSLMVGSGSGKNKNIDLDILGPQRQFTIRADTGFDITYLFDELAKYQLNGPPRRYAMGADSSNTTKVQRESCGMDCVVM